MAAPDVSVALAPGVGVSVLEDAASGAAPDHWN
jgi:hypothetical protein